MTAGNRPGTLLVDARPVDHPTARNRGIGRYVTGLLRGLHAIDAPVVALYATDDEAAILADDIGGLHLERWSTDTVRRYATDGSWYLATQLMLHPIPLDPIPSVISRARLPVAAVMYDVIPFRYRDTYLREPNARVQALLRTPLARTTDAMLAISEFARVTAADELDYPIERIATIGAGVESRFVTAAVRPLPRADRVLPADLDHYVVAVTGGDVHKNTEGLLRAWGRLAPALRARHRLVIATGRSPEVLRRWERTAIEAGIADEVVFTGFVSDDELVSILQGATLAVHPSVEEGFGLPVLEAAACGAPVICSNASSLPEVLAEPRAEFDPHDPDAIAAAIAAALTDDDLRTVLADAGRRAVERWTWERVADDAMEALARLGPRWRQTVRRPPPRPAPADMWPAEALGRYLKPWDYDDVIDRRAAGQSDH